MIANVTPSRNAKQMSKHRLVVVGLDGWDDPEYRLECIEPDACHRSYDEYGTDTGPSDQCWTEPWVDNTGPYEWLHGLFEGDGPWVVDAWFDGDGLVVEKTPEHEESTLIDRCFDSIFGSGFFDRRQGPTYEAYTEGS